MTVPRVIQQLRRDWRRFIGPHTLPMRQRQARARQDRCVGTLVGVTGSCGKTTAATLSGHLLRQYGTVSNDVANNAVDWVLRELRQRREPIDYVVQEMSGHGPGALDPLVDVLRIDVAVVTTIGSDHRSAYRNRAETIEQAVAAEKVKLVRAVPATGAACLNADDPLVAAMAAEARCRVVTYGTSTGATLRAVDIDCRWPGRLRFRLEVDGKGYDVQTRLVGSLLLPSILAALAVVHSQGLDLAPAVKAIAGFEPVDQHSNIVETADGRAYINDTFKASMWSTLRLAQDLAKLEADNLVVVLGEVSDTHGDSGQRYRQVLRALAQTADLVIATGRAAPYGERLQAQGAANILAAISNEDVARVLRTRPPGLVYLKASKGTRLGEVIELMAAPAPQEAVA